GAKALSPFKVNALLQQVQAIVPNVVSISSRIVHFVQPKSAELGPDALSKFLNDDSTTERQILNSMFTSPSASSLLQESQDDLLLKEIIVSSSPSQNNHFFIVLPRTGTISPWSSKA